METRTKFVAQMSDVVAGFAALFLSYVLVWHRDPHFSGNPFTIRRSMEDLASFLLLGFCWYGLFNLTRLYRFPKPVKYAPELRVVMQAALLLPLPVMLCWAITREQRKSDLMHAATLSAIAALLLPPTLIAGRALLDSVLRLWSKTQAPSNLLVVGTNKRAIQFVEDVMSDPARGQVCIGFVDDGWFGEIEQDDSPVPLCGPIADLPRLLRERPVHEVIVTLPLASFYRVTADIVALCETHGIPVRIAGQLFEMNSAPPRLAARPTVAPVTVHDPAWDAVSAWIKRAFDVAVSATLLLICLPVLVVVAIAIRLSSEGPVFFKQTRLGLGKREFQIYKFRTMVVNASELLAKLEHLNETGGPTFKLKHDPRITRVGSFLRKTSLDELPQLINVLIGDMSLVGPRPLPLRDYAGFSEDRHRRRFSVKPGITCLWQVMGRSSIPFEQWMALDSQYIDQRTFWLDLKILFQTIPAVLRGSGAV